MKLLDTLAKNFPQFINEEFTLDGERVTLMEYWFKVLIDARFEFSKLN